MRIRDLLDAAGVEYRQSPGNANELTLCCPFCVENGESSDSRYRLGVNESGMAHCYNCHWRSRSLEFIVASFVRVYGLSSFSLRVRPVAAPAKAVAAVARDVTTSLPAEYEPLTGKLDEVGKKAWDYLADRNVSSIQIVEHRIGFAAVGPYAWRVIIPVRNAKGKVRGLVARAFGAHMKPKYLNTPGMKLMWNAHRAGDTAVVVEGVLDGLRVESALRGESKYVAVASLGAVATQSQLERLKEAYKQVLLMPDWDRAGVEGALQLGDALHAMGVKVSIAMPRALTGQDPGDLDLSLIRTLTDGAVGWSRETRFRLQCLVGAKQSLW